MTVSEKRKQRSEELLRSLQIPINHSLPWIENEEDVKLRSPGDVAKRAIALCAVALRGGGGVNQQEAINILDERDAWESITDREKEFLLKKRPSRQDKINWSWRIESLWILLWALGHIEKLSVPTSVCDVPQAVAITMDTPPTRFIREAILRPVSEILDEADLIYRFDWAVVDASLKKSEVPGGLDPGVVYERHYAFNWLIGYMDQEWDDVSTDT